MANMSGQQEMSDRTDAAPLTSERRYGIYRGGFAAAIVIFIVFAGAGLALLFGVTDAKIMLCILLPLMLLSAVCANLFLWWQHKRAVQKREMAANEWASTTFVRQEVEPSAPPETPRNTSSWLRRFSFQRGSRRSTPPPAYQSVIRVN